MALDSTPWFVGGGAQHSPEVARSLAYAATNGSEGIAGVSDLKVQAQAVPNGTVRVITGGALLLNRYAGGTGQTYALRNATATDVTVTATGSGGGRTDLVVARVLDPQYEGAPPADPLTFQYSRIAIVQGVPAGTKTAKELNLGYPAIALAKITLPASTATVTAAMITDLRRIAQPRRERNLMALFPTAKQTIPTSGYNFWPITAVQRPSLYVPEWATELIIVVNMSGVLYEKGATSANTVAGIRTGFANTIPAENRILVQDAQDAGGRYHYSLIGRHLIDSSLRGTNQLMSMQGTRSSGTGLWHADYQTSISIDYEFAEGAQ